MYLKTKRDELGGSDVSGADRLRIKSKQKESFYVSSLYVSLLGIICTGIFTWALEALVPLCV